MNKPKIVDLFCGVGGLSYGFEQAGFETVLAIDNWEDAILTYNNNLGNKVAICEDIHNIDENFIKQNLLNKQIVGIIGGPPCQGFSTVGTRDVNDPRNHLYLEYYRLVKEIKPKFFLIENVKGLLTLNKGMFKKDIINRFSKLGYNVNFELLNAKEYGVPQHRERVFFIGIKNEVFSFPEKQEGFISAFDAISDLPKLDNRECYEDFYPYDIKPQNKYQEEMRKGSNGVYNHDYTFHTNKTIQVISKVKDGGNIFDLPKEYWNIRKYNKAFQRMNSKLPSNTIDTGHRNYFHYEENRVPTVRESARIQSFPDTFIFEGSKTSQYRQVGNAVPPILARIIAKEILKYI